jgi:hypothetical protein
MFDKIGSFILFTLLGLASLAASLISAYSLFLAFQSQNWTPLEATVEKTEIITSKSSNKNGKNSYKTTVLYTYVMAQKQYTGEDICLANFISGRADYNEVFYKLNGAKKIRIFVNPDNFNQSVIVNGFSYNIFILLYITLFSSYILFVFLTAKKSGDLIKSIFRIGFLLVVISAIFLFLPENAYFKKYNLAESIVVLQSK